MTEQQTNWLDEEAKRLANEKHNFEDLPSLKLTPSVVVEIEVDASKPFEVWKGEDAKGKPITKKIIPIVLNGSRMNFWLNVRNPVYRELIEGLKAGTKKFKILQTGTQANTKYVLVK